MGIMGFSLRGNRGKETEKGRMNKRKMAGEREKEGARGKPRGS